VFLFDKYVFLCDFTFRANGEKLIQMIEEAVYPISADSVNLWNTIINRRGNLALDLCTGSGFHAILAAKYFKQVIGIDNNPRAIQLANLNKALNQANNVEFIKTDLLKTKKSYNSSFDLIITNPPAETVFTQKKLAELSDGYTFLSHIIKNISRYLTKKGKLYVSTRLYEGTKSNSAITFKKWTSKFPLKLEFRELQRIEWDKYASYTYLKYFNNYKDYFKKSISFLKHLYLNRIKTITYGILTATVSSKHSFVRK
jgi:methylase of polypeptide subunit release factors